MKRRDVLRSVAGAAGGFLTLRFAVACSADEDAEAGALSTFSPLGAGEASGQRSDDAGDDPSGAEGDASTSDAGAADASTVDASVATVRLYDTNAVAMYFDGSMGPYTGVIKVEYILANTPLTLQFWHGHGGIQHQFTLLPEHFAELKRLKRVTLETTVVDRHAHKLFIDPVDPRHRVRGAVGVDVPL